MKKLLLIVSLLSVGNAVSANFPVKETVAQNSQQKTKKVLTKEERDADAFDKSERMQDELALITGGFYGGAALGAVVAILVKVGGSKCSIVKSTWGCAVAGLLFMESIVYTRQVIEFFNKER